jgi:hypothetical protein
LRRGMGGREGPKDWEGVGDGIRIGDDLEMSRRKGCWRKRG